MAISVNVAPGDPEPICGLDCGCESAMITAVPL